MVIGSFSYTVINLYASTAAATPAPSATPAPAPAPVSQDGPREADDHGHHHRHHGHHRRSGGIIDAVRTALRELLPAPAPAAADAAGGSPAAAPAAAPAPAPAASAAPADDFALALWKALREAPSTDAAQRTERRYGDLPQRLETLAGSLASGSAGTGAALVEAFGSVLKTLGGGTAPAGDARALLAGFLHRIADALAGGPAASGAAPTGQLVNTCA